MCICDRPVTHVTVWHLLVRSHHQRTIGHSRMLRSVEQIHRRRICFKFGFGQKTVCFVSLVLPHSATTVFCCWRLICGRFECHNVFKQDPSPHNSKQLSWLFFILEAYCWLLLLLLLLLLLSTEFVQSRDVENIWQYVLVCGCVGASVCTCVLRVLECSPDNHKNQWT